MKYTNNRFMMAMLGAFTLSLVGCSATVASSTTPVTTSVPTTEEAEIVTATVSSNDHGLIDASSLFSDRDLEQTVDYTNATYYTVSDGQDISITSEGIYVLSGSATEVTISIETDDSSKVQLVLDGVTITNTDFPCIYVKNADKVFITTTSGSENSLSVTGSFLTDGDTNTDAVIFSKDDLTLNGLGTLTISSSDNGITSKNDLTITGGTYNITSENGSGLEAHDSIAICDGTFNITAHDGIHAKDSDDDTVGFISISGGTFTINASDDGIHATTILEIDNGTFNITALEGLEATEIQINDGTINISASDDGINAAQKSTSYSIFIEINGGTITIEMGDGDTDGIDSNGDLTINGGTITITCNSPFDYDGIGTYNGGTLIVNGEETTELTNQFAGGMGDFGGMQGGPGNMPGGNDQGGPNAPGDQGNIAPTSQQG